MGILPDTQYEVAKQTFYTTGKGKPIMEMELMAWS